MKIHFFFLPYVLYIIWSFIFPMMGLASDCAPVNLITEENSPFAKIPVYDQGKINICYAYSAAQMVDYHLIKSGATNRNVHPAWVALNYSRNKSRNNLEIGHTKDALEGLMVASNCDYDAVALTLKTWAAKEDISESRILTYIERNTPNANTERLPASVPTVSELKNSNLSSVQMLSQLLVPVCPEANRTKLNLPQAHKYNFKQLPTDEAFASILESKLETLRAPLSIAYCSNVWKKPDYDGIHFNGSNVRDALSKDCHYHESLVVGKKKIGDTCNFLVRNTWGDNWKSDNKNWSCVCKNKTTGEYFEDCRFDTHDDKTYAIEACWLPGDKVARNTGLVTFME